MTDLDIIMNLRKIMRSISLESKKIEKQFGITIVQFLCLQFLSEQDGYKATSSQLKEYLNLNASTTSGIISRLELKGYLAKLPKTADKRKTTVILTAKGEEVLKTTPTTLQKRLNSGLEKMSKEEIGQLEHCIERLVLLFGVTDSFSGAELANEEPSVV